MSGFVDAAEGFFEEVELIVEPIRPAGLEV
jgi:hypothetical protein